MKKILKYKDKNGDIWECIITEISFYQHRTTFYLNGMKIDADDLPMGIDRQFRILHRNITIKGKK